MKITDPDIIKNGEKDLIDAVKDDLDLDAVKDILQKKLAAAGFSASGGEIIVHNNEIAFRIDFNIELSGSLMFDRQGNYIPGTDEASPSQDALDPNEDAGMDDLDLDAPLEIPGSDKNDSDQDSPDTPPLDEESDIEHDDDELNIDLPDYSLDDGDEEAGDLISSGSISEQEDLLDDNDLDDENDDDLGQLEKDLGLTDDLTALNGLDDDAGEDETKDTTLEELEENAQTGLSDSDDAVSDSLDDEDISDILKESRDFWEQKKDV